MPKMVQHDFVYPLGHILTAKYWQSVRGRRACTSPWPTRAGPRPPGGRSTASGSAAPRSSSTTTTGSCPRQLLGVIALHGVTSFCAPPTIYRFFIKEDLSQYDFSSLRHCSIAGEPLNPEVYNRFLEMTGLKLREGYGQTEMTVAVAVWPWIEPKPGSMGMPSPGYDIDLLDDEGKSCEVGEKGEIVVRTDRRTPAGMFHGYYRDPELTQHAPGTTGSTGRATWPGATRTATCGSSAARTT